MSDRRYRLSGGLRIRSASFAEGDPPRIEIAPFPEGATVTIDGHRAEQGEDGAWTADGWERPGDHLIDVVPGPSAAYRIIEDPWTRDGWEAWDAHPERFGASARAPWAVAQVCGAARVGPWRRICRGGRCDAVRCLPWASARRRRAPGTARCAGRGGSARRAPSIPHLCMGAAAEAGPYCMAQSTTGCVRHARDRSAMGRRGAKRLREKASARWWRCAG